MDIRWRGVLSVLALVELGIREIWAKVITDKHGRILSAVGAYHVIYPEAAMGDRVAHLITSGLIDFIEFEDGFAMAKTRTPAQAADRTLAEAALRTRRGHVPGPYVLAGHSFGGLYVLAFAARYPDEVAGMVLVDSTAPAPAADPGAASPGDGSPGDLTSRVSVLISISARLGLGRVYGQFAVVDLPRRSQNEVRASVATASNLRSTIDEYVQAGASVKQAASLRDFAGKPLIVLTAGSGHNATSSAAQDHLATLSTNSVHRVIAGATHEALVGDEEHSAATTQAILDVVSSVRNPGPLVR